MERMGVAAVAAHRDLLRCPQGPNRVVAAAARADESCRACGPARRHLSAASAVAALPPGVVAGALRTAKPEESASPSHAESAAEVARLIEEAIRILSIDLDNVLNCVVKKHPLEEAGEEGQRDYPALQARFVTGHYGHYLEMPEESRIRDVMIVIHNVSLNRYEWAIEALDRLKDVPFCQAVRDAVERAESQTNNFELFDCRALAAWAAVQVAIPGGPSREGLGNDNEAAALLGVLSYCLSDKFRA